MRGRGSIPPLHHSDLCNLTTSIAEPILIPIKELRIRKTEARRSGERVTGSGDLSTDERLWLSELAVAYGVVKDADAALDAEVLDVTPWDPVTTDRRPRIEVTLAETDARLERLACFVSGQGAVAVDWIEEGRRFAVAPAADLPLGRSRVNCTAPAGTGNRFHWFGHPWFVRPEADSAP